MEDNFFIVFNNKTEENLFFKKINVINKHMKELVSDGCLLPENALAELQFICSNRNIANFSEIELVEKIRYEINDLINTFDLKGSQISNLSKYITASLYN